MTGESAVMDVQPLPVPLPLGGVGAGAAGGAALAARYRHGGQTPQPRYRTALRHCSDLDHCTAAFLSVPASVRVASVSLERGGRPRVTAGIRDLRVLKTTQVRYRGDIYAF